MELSHTEQALTTVIGFNADVIQLVKHATHGVPQRMQFTIPVSRKGRRRSEEYMEGCYVLVLEQQARDLVLRLRPQLVTYGVKAFLFALHTHRVHLFGDYRSLYEGMPKAVLGILPCSEQLEIIRMYRTAGLNDSVTHDDIVITLRAWKDRCKFEIISAGQDWIDLEFITLPADLEAFAIEVIDLCTDVFTEATQRISPFRLRRPDELLEVYIQTMAEYERHTAAHRFAQQLQHTHCLELWWS